MAKRKTTRRVPPGQVPEMPSFREYSAEERERIIAHICNELMQKRSLTNILSQDAGMPCYAQFAKWQRESETIAEAITHAREAALEAIIEEIIEISDDASGDLTLGYDAKGKPYPKIDGDNVQRAKLKVYAREKVAALLAPRRFGTQRMDVTSDGKALPAAQNVTLVEQRVASILAVVQERQLAQREALKMLEE